MCDKIRSRFLRSAGRELDWRRSIALVVCSLMLAIAPALGQSGRKQKKPTPEPPVQGVNQPQTSTEKTEPASETPAEKPKEKGPAILVATEMADMAISSIFPDIAREGCMRELREGARGLEIRDARNQTRADAIKAAKEDDRTYVVWMQFELDRMGTSTTGFDLRYTIFEPKTGKVLGSGSGYPVSGSRMPVPPIGASRAEVQAEWAGRDVAHQVLKRLHLKEL